MYIYSSSAISNQDSFDGTEFSENLVLIENQKDLRHPIYKEYVTPMVLRRMGTITRMSVACAFKCLQDANVENPDAIIVGTGMGALADTQKFLNIEITVENALLPPTAFIGSGHNSMAGQIALLLKNDNYNMTHVQQGLSFEHAVLDAMLNITEGKKAVLTGAVDELTPVVTDLAKQFGLDTRVQNQLSQGAGFFLFGNDKSKAKVEVKAVSIRKSDSVSNAVAAFLNENELDSNDISTGYIGYNLSLGTEESFPFSTVCYTDYCGQHAASSSFGMHLASIVLSTKEIGCNILVININPNTEVGLTWLQRV